MTATRQRQDPQGLTADRLTYRVGGIAAVAGSVLAGIGNLLHPVTPIDDPEGVARVIADSGAWTMIHVIIVVGIVLMLGGLVGLHHAVRGGLAGALARLGLAAAVTGVAIGVVLVILDGVAAKQLADEWARAPAGQQATALRIVLANETINFALASAFNIVFAGATFICFGLAVAFTDVFPRALGWIAVAAGTLSIAAGLIQAFAGVPTSASRVLTIIGPTVITLWLLAIGLLLVRHSQHQSLWGGRAEGRHRDLRGTSGT